MVRRHIRQAPVAEQREGNFGYFDTPCRDCQQPGWFYCRDDGRRMRRVCRECMNRTPRKGREPGPDIEAMASGAPRRPWNSAEELLITAQFAMVTRARLQSMLYAECGSARTLEGIRNKAGNLRLTGPGGHGYLTAVQAAALLGISRTRVNINIAKGKIRAAGRGSHNLIAPEEIERLRQYYPGVPAGWIAVSAATSRLGYSRFALHPMLRAGEIRGVMHAGKWYVDPAEVARIEAGMRLSGLQRHKWADTPQRLAFRRRERERQMKARRRA